MAGEVPTVPSRSTTTRERETAMRRCDARLIHSIHSDVFLPFLSCSADLVRTVEPTTANVSFVPHTTSTEQ